MIETPGIEISVVSPVYMAEACLSDLYRRLTETLRAITDSYEIVLVEDCGPDDSWQRIQQLAAMDPKVRGFKLSRNFGQHTAIAAGLTNARGKRVVVMDCDLQDPPEAIPQLVDQADNGFDIVFAVRKNRRDPLFKRLSSRFFFFFMNSLSDRFVASGVGTFSLLTSRAVKDYLRVVDMHSHYLSVVRWLGHQQTSITIPHGERLRGSSSYSFSKLIIHALNGLVSQSTRLLHISTCLGFLFGLLAVLQILYLIYRKLFLAVGVAGWASLMAVLWLVGGAILVSLGVLGLYLGRMFEQVKDRPLFIVGQQTDEEGG